MIAFIGVDGTGSYDPGQYHEDYNKSNISNFARYGAQKGKSKYLEGPGLDGSATWYIASNAAGWARSLLGQGCKQLVMAGHSRGGAAVIEAAYQLMERDGVQVDLMLLFDAVNMTSSPGLQRTHTLPGNIKVCRHAYRDPAGKSRRSWGNCGMARQAGSTDFVMRKFWTTHGGIGGVPPLPAPGQSWDEYIVEDGTVGITTNITYKACHQGAGEATAWLFGELNSWLGSNSGGAEQANGISIGVPAAGGANGAGPKPPPASSKPARQYTVVSGDSLSLISGKFYQDVLLWPIVYDANRSVVGSNPNLIQPGMRLGIPDISGMSSAELSQTRERGRNWR